MNAPVTTIGIDARLALAPGRGEVAAVFRRSFYLRMGDHWACGGAAEIGHGPLNFLFATAGHDWRDTLAPGQIATVDRNFLMLAGHAPIDLARASIWVPSPFPDWSRASVLMGLRELEDLLPHFRLPDDGFGCFACTQAKPKAQVARFAAKPIGIFLRWLAAECPACDDCGVEELLGAGPGLTPSGDDFLAGSLLALHAIGRDDLRQQVWRAVKPRLPHCTHAVSAAHLTCAAEGRLSEAQHGLLGALLAGDVAALNHGITAISGETHTSSWDGLAGMVCTLRALLGHVVSPGRH